MICNSLAHTSKQFRNLFLTWPELALERPQSGQLQPDLPRGISAHLLLLRSAPLLSHIWNPPQAKSFGTSTPLATSGLRRCKLNITNIVQRYYSVVNDKWPSVKLIIRGCPRRRNVNCAALISRLSSIQPPKAFEVCALRLSTSHGSRTACAVTTP